MNISKPYLFVDIDINRIIFCAVKYNEDLNFKVLEKKIVHLKFNENQKINNLDKFSDLIKKETSELEKKLNIVFKKVVLTYYPENLQIVNISGFKKVNGEQILHEDISYIINDIKNIVMNNYKDFSLIHIFNSDYVLDKNSLNNLPIGLYGEFYNHHLTFFLTKNNEIKNLKRIFSNSHLQIEKITLKPFVIGIQKVIEEKNNNDPLLFIYIFNDRVLISIFFKSSLIYCKEYKFGSNIIKKDISKVCSLDLESVDKILKDINFDKVEKTDNSILDKKYFEKKSLRKTSIYHIKEIIMARLNEIFDIILNKNIDLNFIKNKKKMFYIKVEDIESLTNLKETIIKGLVKDNHYEIKKMTSDDYYEPCLSSAEILSKGWEKEAIPITNQKKSIISKIFSTLFK